MYLEGILKLLYLLRFVVFYRDLASLFIRQGLDLTILGIPFLYTPL